LAKLIRLLRTEPAVAGLAAEAIPPADRKGEKWSWVWYEIQTGKTIAVQSGVDSRSSDARLTARWVPAQRERSRQTTVRQGRRSGTQ
jgi:hypothetical protein